MDKLPAVAFAEESCEAMLSRLSHRCDVHRQLVGIDATIDLFLTLPPTSRKHKSSRGALRQGLVSIFLARLRRLLFSDGSLPYAKVCGARTMHVEMQDLIPTDF